MTQRLTCEHCDMIKALKEVPPMTAYHWDGKGDDPNPTQFLCKECEDEYVAYWSDMWAEYER